ncbi:MAG: hypothetical protein NXI04_26770 [Planctomycetaceae bacterium]|nr:hypothetical protein [Planctomycetaceae bacterium]
MTNDNEYQQIDVLIPGYSIEDIPTDLPENSAASLLNAVAVAWHPSLLLAARSLPNFTQAEATELPTGQHIVLIPECSEEWLGHDWPDHFDDTLSLVISECHQRDDYLGQIDRAFPDQAGLSPDLLDRFLALGTCYLQVTLLSRRMHHYVDPDNYLLETETLAAAQAAIAGDAAGCDDHLRRAFECLLDCREQFYPVDCYFVDVCLPSDQTTTEQLLELLKTTGPLSLICSGEELQQHGESAEFQAAVAGRLQDETLTLLSGHRHELRTSLSSLSAVCTDLSQRPNWLPSDPPLAWARRRFGLTAGLPAVLTHFDFSSALHVVLDDGIYPDREYGQLCWQAPDGTTLDSVSRIPMAIDGAAAFLRFADRYTESMQEDTNAVALLARLPDVKTPWLNDLKLAAKYAPVLGRFVTFGEFVAQTAGQSSPTRFKEGEYLSPYLIQSSVLKTEAPITSPQQLHLQRDQLEHAAMLDCIAAILKPGATAPDTLESLRRSVNEEEATHIDLSASPDLAAAMDRTKDLSRHIQQAVDTTESKVASLTPGSDGDSDSLLLLNSLPWKRRAAFAWPPHLSLPSMPQATEGNAEFYRQDDTTWCSVDVPAGGFLWFDASGGGKTVKPTGPSGKPLAEDLLLRNKFYEVHISEASGGIADVRFHNQRANRVSQLVAFRYESAQTVRVEDEELVCAYAATQMVSSRVVQAGPFFGRVETTNRIIDVGTEEVMATFRQTTTVQRDSSVLQIQIDVDELHTPVTGNPWMTYLASRFAWDNESASISRSMMGQAAGFRMERFEAPDYIEVADSDQRLLIMPDGRPYHRRSGGRMLDSLLIVEGEPQRSFTFHLDFDQPVPMRSVLETRRPVTRQQPTSRRPGPAASGWVLGVSSKNVQIARSVADRSGEQTTIRLLLQETEGRATSCRLVTARAPAAARLISASGRTLEELSPAAGGTVIKFGPFQLKEVELTF